MDDGEDGEELDEELENELDEELEDEPDDALSDEVDDDVVTSVAGINSADALDEAIECLRRLHLLFRRSMSSWVIMPQWFRLRILA
jgi:hypothetical protein